MATNKKSYAAHSSKDLPEFQKIKLRPVTQLKRKAPQLPPIIREIMTHNLKKVGVLYTFPLLI